MRQAAGLYLQHPRTQLIRLNTGRVRRHWNALTHVLIAVDAAGQRSQIPSRGLLHATHNKIKHGFNVLESIPAYARLPRTPRLLVVRFGRAQRDVERLRENVGNLAKMCNRTAHAILGLDAAGLWR
jgi:hypothetical protein